MVVHWALGSYHTPHLRPSRQVLLNQQPCTRNNSHQCQAHSSAAYPRTQYVRILGEHYHELDQFGLTSLCRDKIWTLLSWGYDPSRVTQTLLQPYTGIRTAFCRGRY